MGQTLPPVSYLTIWSHGVYEVLDWPEVLGLKVRDGRHYAIGIGRWDVDDNRVCAAAHEGVEVEIDGRFVMGNAVDVQHGCAAVAGLRPLD